MFKISTGSLFTFPEHCLLLTVTLGLQLAGRAEAHGGDEGSSTVNCPTGFQAFDDLCYAASTGADYTWDGAESYCQSLDVAANLPCPADKSETDTLKIFLGMHEDGWLAMNDREQEDEWVCLNQGGGFYDRWKGSQPYTDTDANCAAIDNKGDYRQYPCTDLFYALCVLDPAVTVAPQTSSLVTTVIRTTSQHTTDVTQRTPHPTSQGPAESPASETTFFSRVSSLDSPKEIISNMGTTAIIQCGVYCVEEIRCSAFLFSDWDPSALAVCQLLGDTPTQPTPLPPLNETRLYIKQWAS